MSGSGHLDRASHVEIGIGCQIFVIVKVEIILEHREVAFLSPSKICENLNFFYCAPLKIQIFANFAG